MTLSSCYEVASRDAVVLRTILLLRSALAVAWVWRTATRASNGVGRFRLRIRARLDSFLLPLTLKLVSVIGLTVSLLTSKVSLSGMAGGRVKHTRGRITYSV